jgi:DNA/RNA-binding protein KIN17
MTGEERERRMLDDQIARAKADAEAAEKEHIPAELQKRDGEKISLNLFGPAPIAPTTGQAESSTTDTGAGEASTEAGPSKPSFSFGAMSTSTPAPIVNPLKRPAPLNVFKTAKTPKSEAGSSAPMKQKQLSEVERLMQEDQARKMNRPAGRGGYQGHGPRRG